MTDQPSAPSADEQTIEQVVSHWFVQGGEAQFGPLPECHNADEVVAAILSAVRVELTRLRAEHDQWQVERAKLVTCMFAAIDVVKAQLGSVENWPDVLKDAWSNVVVADDQRLTPEEIIHCQELAKRHGWFTTDENGTLDTFVKAPARLDKEQP